MNKKQQEKTVEERRAERIKKIYNKAKRVIKQDQESGKNELIFINDVVANIGVSISTFYEHLPAGSEELDSIKDMIEKTRVKIKTGLRKKMFNSTNALGHIALYKLIGTDEERAILNQQDVRLSGSVEAKVSQTVTYVTRKRPKSVSEE